MAIKFEDNQAKGSPNQLKTEYDTLRIVNAANPDVQGFSKAYWRLGGLHAFKQWTHEVWHRGALQLPGGAPW